MSETESEQVSVVGLEEGLVLVLAEAWASALVTVSEQASIAVSEQASETESEQVSVVGSEQGSVHVLVEVWASALLNVSEQVSITELEQVLFEALEKQWALVSVQL
jgi:hypothetical protein